MKNIPTHTTIEESKTLLNLGVSDKDATFYYTTDGSGTITNVRPDTDVIPAWTTWELIHMLPEEFTYHGQRYVIDFYRDFFDYITWPNNNPNANISFETDSMISSIIVALEWLHSNDIQPQGKMPENMTFLNTFFNGYK